MILSIVVAILCFSLDFPVLGYVAVGVGVLHFLRLTILFLAGVVEAIGK